MKFIIVMIIVSGCSGHPIYEQNLEEQAKLARQKQTEKILVEEAKKKTKAVRTKSIPKAERFLYWNDIGEQ